MAYKTDQESFWAEEFGNSYIQRNDGEKYVVKNTVFFGKALKSCGQIESCIEFGSNIGLNLRALNLLYPKAKQYAVEINSQAAAILKTELPECTVFDESILEFSPEPHGLNSVDFAFIKGVLIHVNPAFLNQAYSAIKSVNPKFVMMAEYYSPSPISIQYRGHEDRLFKRDFCGEFMDLYPEYQLRDYGFLYHRDRQFSFDDLNWFLLERQ